VKNEATTATNQWERLAGLFEGALALPPAERDAYVRERCPDPAIAAEIRALLSQRLAEAGPVERVMAALGSPAGHPWRDPAPRSQVGPYELLREIGRGGMGMVYLARRADGLYQRLVALKLARAPVLDATLRDRFLSERDILAGLAHPNIATLFDGGVTDDGLPYFTMEYVDGRPIDAYCDANRLDLRARIRMFVRTCGAVAAAHRALVVHRDLKPSNVLVTATGEVKLLDFGIAKLLATEAPDRSAETATDSRIMTPAYASPEQVMGAPVSTATDVYALGLLLYELLCGRRAHRLESRGAAHLEQVIVHSDPIAMAEALTRPGPGGDSSTAEAIARARQTTPARLARQLRGDLARIAEMALRKDPERRYATAAHVAEDLERYLDGRPVLARPHSLIYRASRFARRHRLTLAAAALVVAALVGYTVLSVQHAREMEQAAAREQQEAARAREVSDFVVGLFEGSDPNVVQNRDAPVARMLEQGLQRTEALSAQPLLQARLLNAIGRVYVNLGKFDAAADIATRALAASRLGGGEQHPDVARDYRLLGMATLQLGKPQDAAGLFRKALDIHRAGGDPTGVETAADHNDLGYSLAQAGQLDDADRYISEALSARRALLAPGHEDTAMSVSHLAFVRNRQGRPREAIELYREALAMRVARLGERHPEVARGQQNLATVLYRVAEYDEAAGLYRKALEGYRAVYGERHPSIATTLNNLGTVESNRNRLTEAVAYGTAAFEMRRELLGPQHPSTLVAQANLANYLDSMGRLAESEAMLRDVLAQSAGQPAMTMSLSRLQLKANLAGTLRKRGKLTEAEKTVREALTLVTKDVSPFTEASILGALGKVLIDQKRDAEAADALQRALDIRSKRLKPDHPDVVATRNDLEAVRRRLGRK
jgi:serine/threonine protein kinase/Tfp pilus assembly protein PilF